jgi:hypothetical protein
MSGQPHIRSAAPAGWAELFLVQDLLHLADTTEVWESPHMGSSIPSCLSREQKEYQLPP